MHTIWIARTLVPLGLLGFSTAMFGQNVSLGVIGGIGFGDDFRTRFERPSTQGPGYSQTTGSNGYLVGPSIELQLRPRLSVEVDALYRALHFTSATVLPDGTLNSVSPATVVTWQFPILAKYRFSVAQSLHPFVEGGPSFRAAGNLNGTDPSHYGATLGAGIDMRAANWVISPRVRYTRWARDRDLSKESIQNRTELLVAFSRAADSDWRPLGSRFSLGVIAGTAVTDDFRISTSTITMITNALDQNTVTVRRSSGPRSLNIGPAVEANLWHGVSVQASALYRPVQSRTEYIPSIIPGPLTTKWSMWHFPLLARYKLSHRRVAPVVELGPSFRTPQEIYGSKLSVIGITAGVGVNASLGRVRISPALRYTHWGPESHSGQSQTLRNQVALVVGFSL